MHARRNFTTKMGDTLSQRGLSIRINRSTSWIRKQGALVSGVAGETPNSPTRRRETWQRIEYSDRRLFGYKLMAAGREVQ